MPKLSEINFRDPFIVPVAFEKKYYLFGTTGSECWGKGTGFYTYVSPDLEMWDGPHKVFTPPPDFWADRNFWAPEVHAYQGRYYLFAAFKKQGVYRGTQILAADHPLGLFTPHSPLPVTPNDWECLDGTLYVDRAGQPWLIFCQEWTQVHNGSICAVPLEENLRAAKDVKIKIIFFASAAPWVQPYPHKNTYVTDGPFLHRMADGTLCLLWSSFRSDKYVQGVAYSQSGEITGPWQHDTLFTDDGGHGMLFRTCTGDLQLVLHTPNKTLAERPRLLPIKEENSRLILAQ
jgi:beta-xylosidase